MTETVRLDGAMKLADFAEAMPHLEKVLEIVEAKVGERLGPNLGAGLSVNVLTVASNLLVELVTKHNDPVYSGQVYMWWVANLASLNLVENYCCQHHYYGRLQVLVNAITDLSNASLRQQQEVGGDLAADTDCAGSA